MNDWPAKDQYAISFFIYTNEDFEYEGCTNVPYFAVSYNCESSCDSTEPCSEERWNYAYWPQDESMIIDPDDEASAIAELFDWYHEIGLENVGVEAEPYYDEVGRYIGKGAEGLPQLLEVVTEIARELQESGWIAEKFGKPLPIIIHDLEYCHYMIGATRKANPHGETDDFLRYIEKQEAMMSVSADDFDFSNADDILRFLTEGLRGN